MSLSNQPPIWCWEKTKHLALNQRLLVKTSWKESSKRCYRNQGYSRLNYLQKHQKMLSRSQQETLDQQTQSTMSISLARGTSMTRFIIAVPMLDFSLINVVRKRMSTQEQLKSTSMQEARSSRQRSWGRSAALTTPLKTTVLHLK